MTALFASMRRLLFTDKDNTLFINSLVDGDMRTVEHLLSTGSVNVNNTYLKHNVSIDSWY
jgi:hypothetical protein